ncbi:LysR family transcriptional regulator [Clostridium estertheticum]|uniref:LysR family transcriptional regulator n=1 Tax=Clostridium estertheticum TaxID=238834 RepID=UPI001CF4F6EA|nr:LysR family transcriptional regulator [Clostridium estertheticum]MCB2305589.1 LysR family transcriptional regulator [Clostridium estertheticum]MCB2344028.1 LysR family transcriptional regulator [Clostridium estertheticum]MCB2348944.1 LysR family transcriptional regulator [Clostridium estertheticum]WAG46259.1 LysR family transcriptional regulator [Clostridium estertheticum]
MDIRLETFITVVRIKSFTKASEILNITQPAVSQHIKFLEVYYGVIFIKKCGKSIKLTEEGKILYKYAIELDSIYRNLEIEFRNKDNINKTYYVGASMTIGGYILPYILAEYKNCYKNIDILLQVNNTEEILKKLLNRKIDLALIEGNFDKEKFKYIKYKDDELVLAVSPLHEFAKYKNITLGEILKGKLILRENGSGTREIFKNKLLEMDYDLKDFNPYMELGSITAIKSLVESNLGYSIISKETVKKEVELGIIKIIPIKGLKIFREFNFVYLKDSDEEFIKNFIGFCVNYHHL